jgi:hypothetical protein
VISEEVAVVSSDVCYQAGNDGVRAVRDGLKTSFEWRMLQSR